MLRPAAGVDPLAALLELICGVEAERLAHECERAGATAPRARGGLSDQDGVGAVAAGGEAGLGCQPELPVQATGHGLAVHVLGTEEERDVRLVPHRPER